MIVLSRTNETLVTYNPRAAENLMGLVGTERIIDDASDPMGTGKLCFKLFSYEDMKHFVNYQCFLLDDDKSKQTDKSVRGPWVPISNIYWGQGYHSQLLAHVDDIDVVRVHHTA